MATASNSNVFPLHSDLLGLATVPVHHLVGADLGHCFFWEQRFWLTSQGITDHAGYRKRENKEGYVAMVMKSWGLMEDIDCSRPTSDHDSLRTHMFSSGFLVSWLCLKVGHAEQAKDERRAKLVVKDLTAIFDMAQAGAGLLDALPVIQAFGERMPLNADFTISLDRFVVPYPTLLNEWEALRIANTAWHLPPWPENNLLLFTSFFTFLVMRARYSAQDLEPGNWLIDLRNACHRIITLLFERCVAERLDGSSLIMNRLEETELWHGRRKHMRSSLTKQQWLRKRAGYGSDETVLNAIADRHGLAASVRHVRNQMYSAAASETMRETSAASLSWDASCHGGMCVNVGIAIDTETRIAVHMKPAVPFP